MLCAVAVLGEVTTTHEVPSHRSTSVCPPWTLEDWPTAQQSDAETHVTPNRRLFCEPRRVGEVTIAHEVPFHRSMSVSSGLAPVKAPTAQQSDADTHATSSRTLFAVGLVLAEVTMAHEAPSQCSMSVCDWPDGGFMMISS